MTMKKILLFLSFLFVFATSFGQLQINDAFKVIGQKSVDDKQYYTENNKHVPYDNISEFFFNVPKTRRHIGEIAYVYDSSKTKINVWQFVGGIDSVNFKIISSATKQYVDSLIDINIIKDITWGVIDSSYKAPNSPQQGDRYLVSQSGSGVFSGKDNQIATFDTTLGWQFQSASMGDLLFNSANQNTYKWNGTSWILRPPLPVNNWWRNSYAGYGNNGIFGATNSSGRPFLLFKGGSYGIGWQVFEGSKLFNDDNIAIGSVSQHHNHGNRNISLGTYSLWYNVTGHDQIAIGYRAAGTGNKIFSIGLGTNVGNRDRTFSISDSTTKMYMKLDTSNMAPTFLIGRDGNSNWTSYRLSRILANAGDGLFIPLNEKAANNGVATLDNSGKIPLTQLPAITTNKPAYVQTKVQMLALDASIGDIAVLGDSAKSYALLAADATDFNNWLELKSPIPSNTDLLPEGSTNQYYTDIRSRNALSAGDGINYNSSTGVISKVKPDWNAAEANAAGILNKPYVPAELTPIGIKNIKITGTYPTLEWSTEHIYDSLQVDSIATRLRFEIQVAANEGVTLNQVDSANNVVRANLADSSSLLRSLITPYDWVDVKDFGAIPNNPAIDNSTAITTAIDSAFARGIKRVVVSPKDTFYIKNAIKIRHSNIQFENNGVIIGTNAVTPNIYSTAHTMLLVSPKVRWHGSATNRLENVSVIGGVWDQRQVTPATAAEYIDSSTTWRDAADDWAGGHTIEFNDITNGVVSGATILGSINGTIGAANPYNVHIVNNTVRGFRNVQVTAGRMVNGNVINISALDPAIANGGADSIYLGGVIVSGNDIDGLQKDSTYPVYLVSNTVPMGMANIGINVATEPFSYPRAYLTGVNILDNKIRHAVWGINVEGQFSNGSKSGSIISGNYVEECYIGLGSITNTWNLNNAKSFIISDNVIKNTLKKAIQSFGSNAIITGNLIEELGVAKKSDSVKLNTIFPSGAKMATAIEIFPFNMSATDSMVGGNILVSDNVFKNTYAGDTANYYPVGVQGINLFVKGKQVGKNVVISNNILNANGAPHGGGNSDYPNGITVAGQIDGLKIVNSTIEGFGGTGITFFPAEGGTVDYAARNVLIDGVTFRNNQSMKQFSGGTEILVRSGVKNLSLVNSTFDQTGGKTLGSIIGMGGNWLNGGVPFNFNNFRASNNTYKGFTNGVEVYDFVNSTMDSTYINDPLYYSNRPSIPVSSTTKYIAGTIIRTSTPNPNYLGWQVRTTGVGGAAVWDTIKISGGGGGAGAVQSVAGKTGVVTLNSGDVGLGNVDNTADDVKTVLQATKLSAPRTINGISFDGTQNITITDATKEPAFSKNTAFNKNFGRTLGTVVDGKEFIDSIANIRAKLNGGIDTVFADAPLHIKFNNVTGKQSLFIDTASTTKFGVVKVGAGLSVDGNGVLSATGSGGISRTDLSGTAPISYNSSTGTFSMAAGSSSVDGYLSSATYNLFNGKQAAITGAATTVTSSNLTANRALSSNASGKIDVATTTLTELNYVNGVTSSIQTQLNTKSPTASPSFTGTPTAPTPASADSTTKVATTAFVRQVVKSMIPVSADGVVPIRNVSKSDTLKPSDVGKAVIFIYGHNSPYPPGNLTVGLPESSGGLSEVPIGGTITIMAQYDTLNFVGVGDASVQVPGGGMSLIGNGSTVTAFLTSANAWTIIGNTYKKSTAPPPSSLNFSVSQNSTVALQNTLTVSAEGGTSPYSYKYMVVLGSPVSCSSGCTSSTPVFTVPIAYGGTEQSITATVTDNTGAIVSKIINLYFQPSGI